MLSDPDKTVLNHYHAWGKNTFKGSEYIGVIRSTYLIDPEGHIVHIWLKVKVNGHPEEVKTTLMQVKAKS